MAGVLDLTAILIKRDRSAWFQHKNIGAAGRFRISHNSAALIGIIAR
jgi:hypothetical protein